MSFLQEIQVALCDNKDLAPILLKLRLLASKLGSDVLEEWVKHESEGYPANIEVPDYRRVSVSYKGTFSGPFNSGIKNAPIPTYLIETYAGKDWTSHRVREGVAAIDNLIHASSGTGTLQLSAASNLILLLEGKVYEDMACNSVTGTISTSSIANIQHVVRARILEFTIELEKKIPAAAEITLQSSKPQENNIGEAVSKITNQIFHGNVTNISNSGDRAQFFMNISSGDTNSIEKGLVDSGISKADAKEFTELLASEQPESKEEPFGPKVKAWIAKSLGKAVDGTWKTGMAVATKVITEAALTYYGLK